MEYFNSVKIQDPLTKNVEAYNCKLDPQSFSKYVALMHTLCGDKSLCIKNPQRLFIEFYNQWFNALYQGKGNDYQSQKVVLLYVSASLSERVGGVRLCALYACVRERVTAYAILLVYVSVCIKYTFCQVLCVGWWWWRWSRLLACVLVLCPIVFVFLYMSCSFFIYTSFGVCVCARA